MNVSVRNGKFFVFFFFSLFCCLVIGALIGKQTGRHIEVMNSFELKFETVDEDIVICQEYYRTKEEQCMYYIMANTAFPIVGFNLIFVFFFQINKFSKILIFLDGIQLAIDQTNRTLKFINKFVTLMNVQFFFN